MKIFRFFIFLPFLLAGYNSFSQTWQDVGGGTNNSSHGLLVWNGNLINLGSFNNPCGRVAQWDGSAWSCLGSGVGIVARDGCVWNGKLVVVGDFWNNFQPCTGCNGIAVWDGTSWTPLDNGFNNDVLTVTVFNGDLIVGGDFTQADGVPVGRVVKWNDVTGEFETIGSSTTIFDNDIRCMVEFEGELWVGGDFSNAGGCTACDGIVKWDGTNWVGGNSGVDIIGGVDSTVRALFVNPVDNNLYMGGHFLEIHDGDAASPDPNMARIARYDGSNWYPLGTGLNQYCRAITEYNGNIIAGGIFTTAGGVPANKIARWNGTSWSALGQGFDGVGVDEYVKSLCTWNGILFAGGAYTQAEGNAMDYIAQWYEAPVQPPVASITTSATSLCAGNCINITDNSTNTPTSWTWSFPGGTPSASSVQNPGQVCFATAGNYTISLTACNSNGCNTTTKNITVNSSPSVSVNSLTLCAGSGGTLNATGATTYLWSPATGLSATTGSSVTANPTTTTTYTITGTTSGCSSSATATVTVNPVPTAGSSNTGPYCSGSTIQLSSSGGTSYSWTGPNGFTSNLQNPTISMSTTAMSGTYTVTVTDAGCSSNSVTNVVVNTTPVSSASNNGPYCEGDNIQLTSSGGTSYNWTGPNGFTSSQQNPILNSSTLIMSGTYSVTVTDGTCSSISTTNVTVSSPPVAASSNTGPYCEGDDIFLSASGGTAYSWSGPGGFTSSLQNPTINGSVTGMAGNYSVVVSVGTCSDNSATTVVINPLPNAFASNNGPYCVGEDILLNATGGTSYAWTGPNGFTSSSQNPTITNSTTVDAGVYSVMVSDGTCDATSTTSVIVNNLPVNTVTVNGFQLISDQSSGTWQWLDCNNGMSAITGETNAVFNPSVNGNYAVQVEENGCSDTSACTVITGIGIRENLFGEIISVYPNPAIDYLQIQMSDLADETYFELTEISGKVIMNGKLAGGINSLSLTQIPAGIYLLKIGSSAEYCGKIVKM